MSVTHLQLVRWSFPAFALILGLFWYKRRRVDQADPGGMSKKIGDLNFVDNKTNKSSKTKPICSDSGVHTDESSSSSPLEETIPSPRKVSESLTIPMRRSGSQPISILSVKSIDDSIPWYDDDDDTIPKSKTVVLSSNPKSEFLTSNKSLTQMEDCDVKVIKESVKEDAEEDAQIPTKDGEKPDAAKTQLEAFSERDSANHSPISGVMEGSVTDEARSEGSTDSGKGKSTTGCILK